MDTKICKSCGIEKSLMDYTLNKSKCKPCRSKEEIARLAKKKASEHRYGVQEVPPGYFIKGVSQLIGSDGETKIQWVKTDREKLKTFDMLKECLSDLTDELHGKANIVETPTNLKEDLCAVYPIGDAHIGLHTWKGDANVNHDLKKGVTNLFKAVDQLVHLSPNAKEALIINVGDFLHADNKSGTTTKGTILDVDTRWPKVVKAAIDLFIRMIKRALEKHDKVTVICATGNHDEHSSIMLSLCLDAFFSNEPRVFIDTSPSRFHWYRFGSCLFGVTHGDTVKLTDLPILMACDRKEDWAETSAENRRWFTGHIHHETKKELSGCTVESFRSLAPTDAWHHKQGYRSGQSMVCQIWHKRLGLVQENHIGISRII